MERINKKIKLKNILPEHPNMKILIDNYVETDTDGNYLINVGYERVSTDKQAEKGFGLDVQEKELLSYAEYKKFPNFVVFIDDGYTGTEFKERPALNLITDLIAKFNNKKSHIRIQKLVVARIDRLGRSMFGILQFVQDYLLASKDAKYSTKNKNREDIDFISLKEESCSIKSEDPMGKMTLMLFAMLAEYDRDNIVLRMQKGKIARLESGKWLGGGNVPYGYRYDRGLGKLIVVEEEAEKVREIFRMYVDENESPNKIAEVLGFKGDVIVRNIIKRKSLTGCIVYTDKNGVKHEVPNSHEAIIPLQRWEEAQEEMKRRSVNRNIPENMLSGLCYCGECGAKMRYQKYGKYHKIICYSHYKSTKKSLVKDANCSNETFIADKIEELVINKIFDINYLGDENVEKDKTLISIIDILNEQIQDLDKQSANLIKSLKIATNDVVVETIIKEIEELEAKKSSVYKQISEEQEKETIKMKIKKAKEILKELKETFPNMSKKEKQIVCTELINKVIIKKGYDIVIDLKLKHYLQKNDVSEIS